MKKVTFLSRLKAEALTPPANAVIISVHDRSQHPADLRDGWSGRLTLEFHDTDGQTLGLEVFDPVRAEQVWDFVVKHHGASELFVHCQMGESRSGAIALAVSEILEIPCYKQALPVTWENHTIYNRLVYRELLNWYAGHNESIGSPA